MTDRPKTAPSSRTAVELELLYPLGPTCRGVTIPQKGDSDSKGLQPKRVKEPTPGESNSNLFTSKIGKNKTPTPGGLRAKRSKEPTPGESDSWNRHASTVQCLTTMHKTNLDARVECESAAAALGLPPLAGGGGGHDGQRQRRHGDRLQREEMLN